ncbi:coiled-coil domain-containing protein 89-like [Pecten maximus]|uniref:coiled-coil domain-containing protein 89-like n=1 Tax=Pecten maximus TaxID=6579 RepID=UPI001457F2CE|nr:coiled-coil domain-containing protein 89-like [Pecten maximus]
MSSNSRNPKDIRSVVEDSDKDMSDMQNNLSKLKGLSADDKTEKAMLRSRIDEQSQLIMILKQRADEVANKTKSVDRINEELIGFRDSAKDMLDGETRKYNILNARFDDLASNHQEMIKIKDEYKRANRDLREENSRLRDENARIFSGAIAEKEEQISELEKKLGNLKDQCSTLEHRNRHNAQEFRMKEEALQGDIRALQDQYKKDMKSLQAKLQEAEERLKSANYKLQTQTDSKKSMDAETQLKIQQLTKEKDELLDLAMQRGKIVHKEQTENKKLQQRIGEMEKAVRNMEEKFEREAAAVNSNLQVRRLRDDLEDSSVRNKEIQSEFNAYKKHTNALLQRERDINEKLRNMVG